MLSRNRCSSNPILDFDNKSMKGTKNFGKFLEHISKGVRFYKAAALQPWYLLKRALLLKKILFMLNSNNPYTVYKSNSRGVFRTQSHIYERAFLQRKAVSNFFKNALPHARLGSKSPLSSERLLQECEYMTNSPSLMI